MKVWVTKYLFTVGIQEKNVRECSNGMVENKDAEWSQYYRGSEWHRTEIDAKASAIAMIAKKRASIRKQLAAIDKLEADIVGTKDKQ